MLTERLKSAKNRVRDAFLGKYNIHGIGIGENSIVIHTSKQLPPPIIQKIKDIIDPLTMKIKICQIPKIQNDPNNE